MMDGWQSLLDWIRERAVPLTGEEIERIREDLHRTDEKIRKLDGEIARLQLILSIFEGAGER